MLPNKGFNFLFFFFFFFFFLWISKAQRRFAHTTFSQLQMLKPTTKVGLMLEIWDSNRKRSLY